MKRKILAFLTAACLMLGLGSMIPEEALSGLGLMSASAEVKTGSCGENLTYEFDDYTGTLTISGTGEMTDYDYWNSPAAPWKNYAIKNVVINRGVTSIGDSAFNNCISLTSINIPDSVTSIGVHAFYYCTSLTSIIIPDSVTSIGYYAFAYCLSLTSITIPDSVTSIRDSAFCNCKNLTSITIPKSVTEIGSRAFGYYYDNGNYKKVNGFKIYCYENTAGEKYAKDNGFDYVLLDDMPTYTVTFLSNGGNGSMASQSIESGSSYTLPECTFSPPAGMEFDKWRVNGILYSPRDSVIVNSYTTVSAVWKNSFEYEDYAGDGTLTVVRYTGTSSDAVIPSEIDGKKVTYIGDKAFYNCYTLKSVAVPDSITDIGSYAFYCCYDLTSINFPDSITCIGAHAFESCHALKSIILPDSLTYIGEYAFCVCVGIAELSVPVSADISESAFDECYISNITLTSKGSAANITSLISQFEFLETITVDSDDPNYSTVNGILYDKEKTVLISCPRKAKSPMNIPESVTKIGERAFSYYEGIPELSIPESIISIGDFAFLSRHLNRVVIPESVVEIGEKAFGYENENSKKDFFYISGYIGSAAETYANENKISFGAKKISLAKYTLTLSEYQYIYDGTKKCPEVTVKDGSNVLTRDIDYTLKYSDNLNAGNAKVTVTGINKYSGTLSESFTITRKALSLSLRMSGWTYGDKANLPTVSGNTGYGTVTYEYKLKNAADSAYSTTVPTAAGTYTVRATVAATDNYSGGTATADFTISQQKEVTVSFKASGGSGSMRSESFLAGSSYTLPSCGFIAPSGKEFDRWSIGGAYYEPGQSITVDSDITVTALWKAESTTCTITIIANNGTISRAGTSVKKGDTYTLPKCGFSAPKGMRFDKWSIGGKLYSVGQTIVVNSDIEIIATWKESTFVPGDADGDSNVNMQDYALLQRYLAGWNVEIDKEACDLNEDGDVNMLDYALMQRLLAGWDI